MKIFQHSILYLFLSSLILIPKSAHAQLVINELCPSNSSIIDDEFGDSSDWIELYNSSDTQINLEGYFLSDDNDEPYKWRFPNTSIAARSYLLIFASDEDVWNEYLHTNFKLSASGENVSLTNADSVLIDRISCPALNTDLSYGRLPNGGEEWAVLLAPSPANNNNGSPVIEFANPPQWADNQYFFENSARIELACDLPNCSIYFTRDGRPPTPEDERYTTAIQIDTTTVIRAITVAPDYLPSAMATRTFFVNTDHELPIISLTSDPYNYWDWEEGILVDGPNAGTEWPYWGANYWVDKDIPVYMEYFTTENELGIAQQVDVKTHGGRGARLHPQKPLRILFKEKYGTPTVEYPFFDNRERTTYKRLVLRNASGDYNRAHFRDAFLQRYFIDQKLDVHVLAYQPVVVYLNGAFYGVLNLREKSDEYYLKYNFGIDIEKLDFLEENIIDNVGNHVLFDTMYNYIVDHDLSQKEFFEHVETLFDTKNLAESFIVQTYVANGDWLHNNIKYWRERKEGERWRYLVFDMDIAMGRYAWSDYDIDMFGQKMYAYQDTNRHVNILQSLLENENYKNYFINRYADVMNTTFRPENLAKEVNRSADMIKHDIKLHFDKWADEASNYELWEDEKIPTLHTFLEKRPPYARQGLIDYFDLNREVQLTFNTFPEGAGKIHVNTITPESLPWDGYYFDGVPIDIRIEPAEGYTFSHWQSLYAVKDKNANPQIRYNFSEDDEVIAYFESASENLLIKQVYLPELGRLVVDLELAEPMELAFDLYDVQGRLLRHYPARLVNGGGQSLYLDLPELAQGMYVLRAGNGELCTVQRFIVS